MTPADARAHLERLLPNFHPSSNPTPLLGGTLNHVFRATGATRTVILKHAPPFVASAPEIPLDTSRLRFEARALETLAQAPHRLAPARAPRPVACDLDASILLMEDLGDLPDLSQWLLQHTDPRPLHALGRALARLHTSSLRDHDLARTFSNLPVQHTRKAVQYDAVTSFCHTAHAPDADTLGARAHDLGTRLLQPGRCWIMGDLWPPSIRIDPRFPDRPFLIDWELTHMGQPAQDLGHLLAHLHLLSLRHPSPTTHHAPQHLAEAYSQSLATEERDALLDPSSLDDTATHMGCELLARTLGPFRTGAALGDLEQDDPRVRQAVDLGLHALREGRDAPFLAPLRGSSDRLGS